jgi:hypothetical protein
MSTTMTNATSWCACHNKRGVCRTNNTVLVAGDGLHIVDRSTFRLGDIIA